MKLKTLVIHPDDRSTDFLKPIYDNIEDKTVITGGVTKDEVNNLIKTHDRVIMLGHGYPGGLFACGKFGPCGIIINEDTVPLLNEKTENIFIWCNADQFVIPHNLKGFYSGMFISEVGEARFITTQDKVDESNDGFAKILGSVINNPVSVIHENVKRLYETLTENNEVATYNYNRLYLS